MNTMLAPLTNGVFHMLLNLWPLWLLMLLPVVIQVFAGIRRNQRLVQAGIDEVDGMDGIMFERYLEVLFHMLGYRVQRTSPSGDFGADLIIIKNGVRTIVQAKRYSKNVGVKAVQEVVAAQKVYNGAHALVVTNSGYTKQAQHLARANNVELWNRDRLVDAILSAKRQTIKRTNALT